MVTIITTSTRNPCSSSIPQICFHNTVPSARLSLFSSSLAAAAVVVKCSNNGSPASDDGSLKDILSGMVDERVEQLLNKEENKALLQGLEQASSRVEIAKRQLAEIQKQEEEARVMREYIDQLESKASEIAESQKEISEARAMVEEAELSLNSASKEMESGMSDKDKERLQSVIAASVSAVVGTLAELPISLSRVTSNTQLILPLAITFASCALFGVTFRYAIRRDLDNFQLKAGTSAAFGCVKGLAMLEAGAPLELNASSIVSHAFDGAVYVSENLLIFLFAGVALDFCIKLRILSPFPIERT
ncbi:hypothetical protein SASPL_142558 [Salvia splendens]|uniref:Homer protein n=1 Tax=Salvia splendens TaxID=180675 RepID=A0A8X8WL36_SALSN|nr:uncharacterized protein LOC121770628 [Salvia splendens]XP_042023316.1 uncharacterized protein LOC121770628 [Salvia splendens]KAG6396409.1 hypothetical protein SASPL_142558 [Salvia splendens]